MTSTAITVALKADLKSTKFANNYFTHGGHKMNKNNTMNAMINTTNAGEEVYEDGADGKRLKKVIVNNITLYICVP